MQRDIVERARRGDHDAFEALTSIAFDRLYGAFPEQVVNTDAKAAVERSADRYLNRITTG